jgi:hypothetical protein
VTISRTNPVHQAPGYHHGAAVGPDDVARTVIYVTSPGRDERGAVCAQLNEIDVTAAL